MQIIPKKFRVFDTRTKEYGKIVDFDDGRIDYEFEYGYSDLARCLKDPDFLVEQFVGLKDVNGEDIYENDIVIDSDNKSDRFIVAIDSITELKDKKILKIK